MSRDGEFWKTVRKQAKSVNPNPVQVGWIKSLEPLIVQYQGLELSTVNGDTLYINNLLLDAPIEFTPAEAITCSHGTITENHTNIINDELEAWIMAIHKRFILSIGDYVAVQRLGNNTYLILEKLQALKGE